MCPSKDTRQQKCGNGKLLCSDVAASTADAKSGSELFLTHTNSNGINRNNKSSGGRRYLW